MKKTETIKVEIEEEKTIDKLKDPDILVKIGKYYSSGMGYTAISKKITNEENINCDYYQIKRVVDIFKTRQSDLIRGDTELQEMVKGAILDVDSQLKKINKECFALLEIAKERKDPKTVIAAIREVRGQLEFSHRILSQLSTNVGPQKINKLEMTQVIVNSLDDLEKQGVIKILKPTRFGSIGIDSEKMLDDVEEEKK